MRDKLIEIITDKLPIVGGWREQFRQAEELGDEILELFKRERGGMWGSLDDHVSDCTCRFCHPEYWMLDSRNIWVRKIGSIGDDVV